MDSWDWIPFIRRNLTLILATVAVVAVATMLATFFMSPTYASTVTLAVQPLTIDKPFDYPTAFEHGANSIGELVKSRSVAERAARKIGGSASDIGPLEVQVMEKSSLIELTAEGHTPDRAATVANAVAESYLEENAVMLRAGAQKSQEALKEKLTDLKGQIGSLQEELNEARTKRGESARVAALADQISSTQSGYEQLLQQWQNIPSSQVALATAVQIAEKAKPDPSPVSPRPVVNLAIAIAAGFFVGLAVARGKDSLDLSSESADTETDDGTANDIELDD